MVLNIKAGGPSALPSGAADMRTWRGLVSRGARSLREPCGRAQRGALSPPRLLREQWIRAKYERQEFTHPDKQEPYSAGKAGVGPSSLRLCLWPCPPVPVSVPVSLCLSVPLSLSLCVCLSGPVPLSLSLCVGVSGPVCPPVPVSLCPCLSVSVSLAMSVPLSLSLCLSPCPCPSVSISLCLSLSVPLCWSLYPCLPLLTLRGLF